MEIKPILISAAVAASSINSAGAAIDLDFSNYAPGSQPDQPITGTGTVYDGVTGMGYGDVANVSSSGINIAVIVEAVTPYSAANTGANGNVSDDIQINQVASLGTTRYRMSFYDFGTLNLFDNGGSNFEFDLVIYDIDGVNAGLETFTILTPASFQLTDTTTVVYDGLNSFSNSSGDITNPTSGSTDLSAVQEDASVILSFTNQNIIEFEITTSGTSSAGRNFFLDGQDFVVFDDAISTGINNGILVVPEPSTFAFLLGLAVLGSVLTRRNR
ncbi:MAG: PEP-CTERM sorting domain-containing protein [Verrucomicrobiota bacterium]